MEAERQHAEEPAVHNAQNWLRLTFHALTCNSPACVLRERCAGGKALLVHIIGCSQPQGCGVPSCSSVRRLLLHWLRCDQDANCRLCLGVWRDLSGFNDQHPGQQGPPRHGDRNTMITPPEQPSTPQREGPASRSSMDGGGVGFDDEGESQRRARLRAAVEAAVVPAVGLGVDRYAGAHGGAAMELEDERAPPVAADRAVVQLQEATAYMRYLLQTLMSRTTRYAPNSAAGRDFWNGVWMGPQQHIPQAVAAAPEPVVAPPPPPHARAFVLAPAPAAVAAAAAGAPVRVSAGRRLMQHRLSCQNAHCALCSGTCDLFTRGHALRHEPALPAGVREMDDIVQELSLALNNFNL